MGREPHARQEEAKIINRLRRANGQLAAVIASIERGEDCQKVVQQLAAVSKAVDRAGFLIISSAMKNCLAEENEGDLTTEDLEKLFLSLA